MTVRFEWHCVGRVAVLAEPDNGLELPECRHPGVYRLRASAEAQAENDAWYVGQSMSSIDERITEHVAEKYDHELGAGKIFGERLQQPGGWCELDVAKDISIEGRRDIVGLRDGTFVSKPELDALDSDQRRKAQFVMNLVESTGQVKGLELFGPQGTR